jgi:hypothetical protein
MLQPHDSRPERTAGPAGRPQSTIPLGQTSSPDSRIEDYLDHVCAPLVGLVPYARRQELRAELRGHLEALVATHEELGSERDAAVVLALRQFGPPPHLSRQWAREWTKGAAPTRVEPAWRATLIALACFGVAALAALGLMGAAMSNLEPYANINPMLLMIGPIGILLPALAGLATGCLAPARHALGTFLALSLLILPSAAMALYGLTQAEPVSHLTWGVGMAYVQPLLWIPIGCATAALGGSLRASLLRQPRQWVLQ